MAAQTTDPSSHPVPEDFPRNPFPSALSGAQLKFSVREVNGKYIEGLTDEERQQRYLVCIDLVDQLVSYTKRKSAERTDLSMAEVLDGVEAAAHRKDWGLARSEIDWVVLQVRKQFS